MNYFVYVLYSLNKGSIYIGQSNDPYLRLQYHNAAKNKATKHAIPWEIAHIEKFSSRAEAMKREKALKSGQGRAWLKSLLREKGYNI